VKSTPGEIEPHESDTDRTRLPDRDPQLFYELSRDRLATQLSNIDALDNKIGVLVGFASGLLGLLAAVFALKTTSDLDPIGNWEVTLLVAASVAYLFVVVPGIQAYLHRSWNVGPDLRQVWDALWGEEDDRHVRWEIANDLWAYYEANRPAEDAKARNLQVVFVGVVIQTALVVAGLVLVAVGA
jgi:hypothetical protein